MYRPNDAIKQLFVIKNPATGAAVNADSLPTVAAYHNGAVDSGVVVVVSNLATGVYLASGVVPASGYAVGDTLSLVASALVSTVSVKEAVNSVIIAPTVQLDLTQDIPLTNGDQTVGDALNAARAQGFGAWSKTGQNLELFAPDGTTPVRAFVLNDANLPTSRV